ncbi:MAG: FimV/HubP family polar landmark protein [Shewanella sp.]
MNFRTSYLVGLMVSALFVFFVSPVAQTAFAAEPLKTTVSDGEARQANRQYGPTQSSDTFWSIAQKVRPDNSVSIYQVMVAIYDANPHAFFSANFNSLEKGMILLIPSKDLMLSIHKSAAKARAERDDKNWKKTTQPEIVQAVQPTAVTTSTPASSATPPITPTNPSVAQKPAENRALFKLMAKLGAERAKNLQLIDELASAQKPAGNRAFIELTDQLEAAKTKNLQLIDELGRAHKPEENRAVFELMAKLEAARARNLQLTQELGRAQKPAKNEDLIELTANFEAVEAKNLQLIDELGRAQDQLNLGHSDIDTLQNNIAELNEMVAILEEQLQIGKQQAVSLNEEIKSLQQQINAWQTIEPVEDTKVWHDLFSNPLMLIAVVSFPALLLLLLLWLFLKRRRNDGAGIEDSTVEKSEDVPVPNVLDEAETAETAVSDELEVTVVNLDTEGSLINIDTAEDLPEVNMNEGDIQVDLASNVSLNPSDTLAEDEVGATQDADVEFDTGIELDVEKVPKSPAVAISEHDLTNFQKDNGFIDIGRLLNEADETDENVVDMDQYKELDVDMGELGSLMGNAAMVDVDDEEHSVNAKLDLARAYIEIGDNDNAKALLKEVQFDGNDRQKQESDSLINSLN